MFYVFNFLLSGFQSNQNYVQRKAHEYHFVGKDIFPKVPPNESKFIESVFAVMKIRPSQKLAVYQKCVKSLNTRVWQGDEFLEIEHTVLQAKS